MSNNRLNFWIDSHVHIYPMYDIDIMLDHAFANFEQASQHHNNGDHKYVLFITQGINENALSRLANHPAGQRWQIQRNNHEFSANSEGKHISLIPGQQLVSSEGIELLIIGGSEIEFEPKQSIHELIELFKDDITILPWGMGKWLGKRGNIISDLLNHEQNRQFMFIGDIPARLNTLGGKPLFSPDQTQILRLRGVDPLPLKKEQTRIGKFGSCLSTSEPLNRHLSLTQNLVNYLQNLFSDRPSATLSEYGDYLPLAQNVASQLKIRLKK